MTNQQKAIEAAKKLISTEPEDHYGHEVENQVGDFNEPYCHDCGLMLDAPEVIDYETGYDYER